MSFCPEIVGSWSPSLQNESELSPTSISRAASRVSRGPVAGNHRQHFFDPSVSNTITINRPSDRNRRFFRSDRECNRIWPSWIEKVLAVISCNWGHGEAGNSSGYRSWRKLRLILKWGRRTSNNFGPKTRANGLRIQLHRNWPRKKGMKEKMRTKK